MSWRVATAFVIAAISCAITHGAAFAGFKSNYAQWRETDSYGRNMYVQGLYDGVTSVMATDAGQWMLAKHSGVLKCAAELGLTADMMSEAVTKHYQDHLDDWALPPALVFDVVMQRICLTFINSERQGRGLGPWEQQNGSIMSSMR